MHSIPLRRRPRWAFTPSRGHISLLALPASALGALPLFGSGPLIGWRILTMIGFLGLAGLLWFWCFAVSVTWNGKVLRRGLSCRDPSCATAVGLAEAGAERAARPYLAWLEFGKDRWLVGESADPARVVSQVVRLAADLELPIRLAWGLTDEALDGLESLQRGSGQCRHGVVEAPEQPLEASWPEQPQQRQSALAIAVSGVASAAVLAFVITDRLGEGLALPLPSVLLSVGFLSLYLVLALSARGSHWHAKVGGELVLGRRDWLGRRTVVRFALRGLAAHRVFAGDLEHLLLFTGSGFVAMPLCGDLARAFVEALRGRLRGVGVDEERALPTRSELPRTSRHPAPYVQN